MDKSVVVTSLKLRQRMGANHYITLTGNVAFCDSNFFHSLQGRKIYGGGIGYGYDSIFGPPRGFFQLFKRYESSRILRESGIYLLAL